MKFAYQMMYVVRAAAEGRNPQPFQLHEPYYLKLQVRPRPAVDSFFGILIITVLAESYGQPNGRWMYPPLCSYANPTHTHDWPREMPRDGKCRNLFALLMNKCTYLTCWNSLKSLFLQCISPFWTHSCSVLLRSIIYVVHRSGRLRISRMRRS